MTKRGTGSRAVTGASREVRSYPTDQATGRPEEQPEGGATSERKEGRDGSGSASSGRDRPNETWLQIIVTWISGLLILAIVGYLVWEGTRPFTPAEFAAAIEEVRPVADHYHVRLQLTNTGGQSVAGLEVVLELWQGDAVARSASAVLDWLPERSSRELVLIVPEDPAAYETVVRFEGYQIP